MIEIKAFVKPNRIQKIIEALVDNGFENITLSQAEGTGSFKDKKAKLSLNFQVTDSPIVKLELVCQDEEAPKIKNIIIENGKSADSGDGIIYLTEIKDAYKIKTGLHLKKSNP
ncbi:MAG: transcriptional regulator [Muricauda sp.]|nr:P-II family nitrogen regulator [Allomuricauda sp.]MAU14454.1 transcriptional regulator [Allomuricauda sp.]